MEALQNEHYVYRITNKLSKTHYIGSRSTKPGIKAINDLGILYFSSSLIKSFRLEQKQYPERFKYKIIRKFNTRIEANMFENKLHIKYDVKNNPYFINQSVNHEKFSTVGLGVYINEQGENIIIPRKLAQDRKLHGVATNTRLYIDHVGTVCRCDSNTAMLNNLEKALVYVDEYDNTYVLSKDKADSLKLKHINKDKVNVKVDGICVKIDKCEFDKSQYQGVAKDTVVVRDGDRCIRIHRDDERYKSGELKSPHKDKIRRITPDGLKFLHTDEDSTEFITPGIGKFNYRNKLTNEIKCMLITEVTSEWEHVAKDTVVVRDGDRCIRIHRDDERYKSGELKCVGFGMVSARDIYTGECIKVSRDEFKNSNHLIGTTKLQITIKNTISNEVITINYDKSRPLPTTFIVLK